MQRQYGFRQPIQEISGQPEIVRSDNILEAILEHIQQTFSNIS
jgi:hypothetical protein